MAPPSPSRSPAQQAKALRESLRLASDLAEALTTQAARVKRQCEQLEEALALLGEMPEPRAEPAAAPAAAPSVATNGPGEQSPARLAAMEMAIQGATREQIDAYLRNNLNISDTAAILDAVLSARRR